MWDLLFEHINLDVQLYLSESPFDAIREVRQAIYVSLNYVGPTLDADPPQDWSGLRFTRHYLQDLLNWTYLADRSFDDWFNPPGKSAAAMKAA